MANKYKKDLPPTFIEVDGEVLPYYRGEDNGPRDSRGVLVEEIDGIPYPNPSYEPTPQTGDLGQGREERLRPKVPEIAWGLGDTALSSRDASVRRAEELTDQRVADRSGTYPGSSPLPAEEIRPYRARRKRGETRFQRAAREHVINARRQRWGR